MSGKTPKSALFLSGGKVASFTLATSESWKDKESGERKERTEWHRMGFSYAKVRKATRRDAGVQG